MKYLMRVVLIGVLAVPAWAQDPGDAPDHGVARVSLLKGEVTVRRGDSGELVAAELNAPLVARDHVLTDEDARAEIQLDWANLVRLSEDSEVRLAELADRNFLIQVATGTVTFRVLKDSNSQVEISTPAVAIRPRMEGTYRILVLDDGSTEITVRSGEVEIFAGERTDYVRAGQTLIVSGDPSDPERIYRAGIPRDEWDRWNESRDRDLERSDSYKYVSRDIYGAEDLSGHGRWVYDSPYGWVWVPTVNAAWAPYRVGRWSWVNYYGWTWVSGDPWGWAPYHYGRWYHAPRYGWVWYPGEIHVRYYWRPALVTFFGWGANIGWVSLAPREIYRPWYGAGRTLVSHVTVVNNVNVVGTYRNARFISGRSGITSIVSGDFGRRRVTVNNFVVGKDRDFKRVGDAGHWLNREPSRENRQFSDRSVSRRVSTHKEVDRKFVSTRPDRNDYNRRDGGNAPRVDARSTPADGRRAEGPQGDRGRDHSGGVSPGTPQRNDKDYERQPDNRGKGENPGRVASGSPGDNHRGTPGQPENARKPEAPKKNEPVEFPRNDKDRDRQAGNPGRGANPGRVASRTPDDSHRGTPGQPENARKPETKKNEPVVFPRDDKDRDRRESNPGRSENPGRVASGSPGDNHRGTPGQPENARKPETPKKNEPVEFPRNDKDRDRQAGNPGRGENPGRVASGTPGESHRGTPGQPEARRTETPQKNEPVVFPRDDKDRDRRESNPGRSENPGRVASGTPGESHRGTGQPENPRRTETPQKNEPVVFPRDDKDRDRRESNPGRSENPGRVAARTPSDGYPGNSGMPNARRAEAPQNDSGREGSSRRTNDVPRATQAPEPRRAEPSGRIASPDATPDRGSSRNRPEVFQRPQTSDSRPSRESTPSDSRPPRESAPSGQSRASRSESPGDDAAPNRSQGNSGGGNGRGRR